MAWTIKHDVDACIGCGACAAICPDNWEMEGGKSKAHKTELNDIGCNKDAADACPVQCIHIEEK